MQCVNDIPRRRDSKWTVAAEGSLTGGACSYVRISPRDRKVSTLKSMTVIRTENLTRSYGLRRGVIGVNLSVDAGEVFGFLGPNGAGKSTTIRMLLGFLKASSGAATILGQDCWKDSAAIKQDVGYVAGDVRLYPWLTAQRAFEIVGRIRGQDLTEQGRVLAEQFRLEVDLPVRKMSRGNRQKVALVLALVHRPKLIILDEPTSGLDPLMQETLAQNLRDLAADGHTVFFSSHTLSEVESLCHRVAIVRDGRIVADESIENLKSRAPREVAVTFQSEAAAAVATPGCLSSATQEGRVVSGNLIGDAAELTRWAAQQDIADISIGRPNLESLFHEYYAEEHSAGDRI